MLSTFISQVLPQAWGEQSFSVRGQETNIFGFPGQRFRCKCLIQLLLYKQPWTTWSCSDKAQCTGPGWVRPAGCSVPVLVLGAISFKAHKVGWSFSLLGNEKTRYRGEGSCQGHMSRLMQSQDFHKGLSKSSLNSFHYTRRASGVEYRQRRAVTMDQRKDARTKSFLLS